MQRNYYNYFTEIEEHFVRRRNKGVIISPLDWSLVETWKENGIPLHVAIRGINRSFDAHAARPKKARPITTIFYCHQSVLEAFEEYLEMHAGAQKEDATNGSSKTREDHEEIKHDREKIIAFLTQQMKALRDLGEKVRAEQRTGWTELFLRALTRLEEITSALQNAPEQSLDYENLERDLSSVDKFILEGLEQEIDPEELKLWNSEAKKELKHYKKNLSKETYEKILKNYLSKRTRQRFNLPHLSLFFV